MIVLLLIASESLAAGGWSYLDKIRFGDLARNSIKDVLVTTKRIKNGGYKEDNPLIAPFAGKGDLHMFLSIVTLAVLSRRWSEMADSEQRSLEMLVANLVEAGALHASKETWQLTLYAKVF